MATRRARIQIKPNTGPRPPSKDASGDKVSISPTKSTAQSQIKTVEKCPTEVSLPPTVKATDKSPIKSSHKPPATETIVELTVIESKKPLDKLTTFDKGDGETESISKTTPHEATGTETDGSDVLIESRTCSSNKSDQKTNVALTANAKGDGKPDDVGASKSIAAPTQRTRLRKLMPKVPDVRRARSVNVQDKDDTANQVVEKAVETVDKPGTNTSHLPPEEVVSNSSKKDVEVSVPDVHSFKKPEVPARRKSVPRLEGNVPAQIEKNTSTEVALVHKISSKKSKNKDNDKPKSTSRKPRTEFNVTEPPDKAKMTIMDLIYWNPINNPMKRVVKEDAVKAIKETSEEDVDDPDETSDNADGTKNGSQPTEEIVPGPRVIVGEDGQITLDESSLVIEQTAPEKDLSQEVLYETSDTTYTSYSKKVFSRKLWSMRETAVFYKALSIVGTDFALMAKFFPTRTRADLKRKFKKEEKIRRDLLDKAVCEWHKFNLEDIQDFLFLKTDGVPADDQDNEAAVDDPDSATPRTANEYVKENFLGKKSKRNSKKSNQDNKKPKGKENEKKPKQKKAAKKPSRNPWSDEEIDPVEEEEMEADCASEEKEAEIGGQECGAEELPLLTTKTSKRQQSLETKKQMLEAKRRKIEEEQALIFEAELRATQPARRSPSPEPMSNSLSFTIVTSKTSTPPKAAKSICSIPSPPTTPGGSSISDTTPTPGSGSNSLTRTMTPRTVTTSTNNVFKIPNKPSIIRVPTSSLPNSSPPSTSTDQPKESNGQPTAVSSPASTSPVLQALLNRNSPLSLPFPNTPGSNPGQFLLVASKTPNNEQVVHVYLVSPSSAQNAAQTSQQLSQEQQASISRTRATAEALLRLGITPIVQKPKESDGNSDKKS